EMNEESKLLYLRVVAKLQDLEFSFSYDGETYITVKDNVDSRMLSTDVAGGFVGNTMGLYCSSNGKPSDNYADFDWLRYTAL
ncbi:MAG: glycoside hydrolase family 43 protein, partial [Clostridiales bacterium]|nr:glycoside hydrolase family 43 protein [Clostridiales bacterium]